jgi:NADPH:quinone reductase-like Zn-dependent oxidoreductase
VKAIVCTQYGTPDILQFKEVPKPAPGDDQVLVKVHAVSVNAADVETLRGDFIVRMTAPRKPMYKILGKVVPVIDRHFTLNEVAEAMRYLGEGHARGKLVITV